MHTFICINWKKNVGKHAVAIYIYNILKLPNISPYLWGLCYMWLEKLEKQETLVSVLITYFYALGKRKMLLLLLKVQMKKNKIKKEYNNMKIP